MHQGQIFWEAIYSWCICRSFRVSWLTSWSHDMCLLWCLHGSCGVWHPSIKLIIPEIIGPIWFKFSGQYALTIFKILNEKPSLFIWKRLFLNIGLHESVHEYFWSWANQSHCGVHVIRCTFPKIGPHLINCSPLNGWKFGPWGGVGEVGGWLFGGNVECVHGHFRL